MLLEDTVVVVKGRLVNEKDQPEIHAREISQPALDAGTAGPVTINLPSTRCTPPVVEQLKEVLRTHPGTTEVRLKLMAREGTTVLQPRRPAAGDARRRPCRPTSSCCWGPDAWAERRSRRARPVAGTASRRTPRRCRSRDVAWVLGVVPGARRGRPRAVVAAGQAAVLRAHLATTP